MPTMADVARLARVSESTVSHVMNGTRKVNDDTRSRVENAIRTLDYHRNGIARALAAGRTSTIGLSVSGLTNQYFVPLMGAIERRVSAAGYLLMVADSHDEVDRERRVVDSLLARQIDGIIVAPSGGFTDASAEHIIQSGTPLVLIDRALDLDCDQVVPENRASVAQLTTHLIGHGHRRIAAVTGLPELTSSQERRQSFLDTVRESLDLDPALVVVGNSNVDDADDAVMKLLELPDPPTALVTLNNSMTIGALRAIRRSGRRVPEDIALAVYDDFEWSDLFEPGLTAVAQDTMTMGSRAADLLLARIAGDAGPCRREVVPTVFHRRTSCGCPPVTQH